MEAGEEEEEKSKAAFQRTWAVDVLVDLLRLESKRDTVEQYLKARPFEPADVGQLNFYLSAVDDRLRHPSDAPTIGLLLCKGKDRVTAEYALRGLNRPIGGLGDAARGALAGRPAR